MNTARDKCRLKPDDLRCVCDPSVFQFKDTSEVEPLSSVIGQQRAVKAIEFGLNMKSPGYNVFVTGTEGTGKSTIVKNIVSQAANKMPTPSDWCMVNNFSDEYRPEAMSIPPGKAIKFYRSMNRLIEDLKIRIPKEFEGDAFQEKFAGLQEEYNHKKKEILEALERKAKEKNLMVTKTPQGYQNVPVINGKPLSQEEFQNLSEEEKNKIKENVQQMQAETEAGMREIMKITKAQAKANEQKIQEEALFLVKDRIDLLREDYKECNEVLEYLNAVQSDILESLNQFVRPSEDKNPPPHNQFFDDQDASILEKYKVNVLVGRVASEGAPVVYEPNPTYQNLFGRIEKKARMGTVSTDFTMIQAGSLLQANGGFLILDVASLLSNAYVWEALKRALQNRELVIEDPSVSMGYATASLKPEPIPLSVKVFLLGDYHIFQQLQNFDSRFNKIFKVRADFDYETEHNEETIHQYAAFIARVCIEEALLPLTPDGVSAVVEYSEKFIADKRKLSLRFGHIVGILKEADYWARHDSSEVISEKHVVKAFNEHRFRYNLYEEKIHESYVDNTIMIDTDGDEIGQVNALAVYQMGDISFGRPSRITAETYMGKHGIINIEREAKLSGKTHDKGVLILSGYLGRTFAQKYPLSLAISVTFEQSYGGVDGDSASSTELYAILSSLADIPVHQGYAVTGSVNQKGKIQAIGGVNQKIEGFFDVCKAKGLTGRQGVLVPQSNVKNLMLKREVVDAAKDGKFHIFGVSTIQEGIEILTGVPAGDLDDKGNYPKGTVYGRVQEKLYQYLEHSLTLKKQLDHMDIV